MITYENMHEIVKKNKPHTISSLKDIQKQILPVFNTGKFFNCDRYHFNNEWVSYTLSDDEPEKTYGIIYVEKMPYINLASFGSEASFIATIDNLVYTNRLKPILLFINNRYIPWSDIEIVFDYGTTYLKIYGQKYNFFTIRKIDMLEIPFPVCTVSIENDYVFNCNFNAMKKYLQENSYMVGNNIHLKIPTLNTIYDHINIGVWYYNQLKLDRLGLLSKDRKDLMSYILVNINGKSNKVNLFDRDSYKRYIVEDMVNYFMDGDRISNVLFRFDDNGYLNPSGNHIIATTNQNIKVMQRSSNTSPITGQVNLNDIENTIFETNFPILFKNKMLNTDYSVNITAQNTYTISNAENSTDYNQDGSRYKHPTGNNYDYFIFYNEELSKINNFNFKFPNTQYAFRNPDIDVSLDFDLSDNHILFEDYHDESVDTLVNFDLREFNELYKTSVYSTCITGKKFNESLSFPLGNNNKYGLKVPRMKVGDRETFAMIFINGLLMKNYNTMIVYPNYLFFTIDEQCNNNDNIEILYFTKCNNNQLTVKYTDDESLKSRLFTDDEVKYFTTDLHDSLTYPDVLKDYDIEEIAFPIYKYNTDNSVSIVDDLEEEIKNVTVVSKNKFIYERLVVDQKSYKIRIDGKRFKYCDNQKQYVLFVNGRRVYNKNFLITIPKITRPFDAMYLYTSNFVNPEDQIDLFYIPIMLCDDEITNSIGINGPVQINGGYMKFNKTKLNYPMDPKLFILFINGKKIATNNLISISSNIVRFTKDPYTTKDISITLLVDEFIPEVKNSLNSISTDSKFDALINNLSRSNYNEIDKLYSQYITVSNIENNLDADPNIGMIAIANEIVRDFWVTSGYDYAGKNPFVYDYYSDQYTTYDENDNLLIPALDATKDININKDDLHHLYLSLTTDEFNLNNIFIINNKDTFDKVNYLELGAKLINPVLRWEYADSSENMTPLISQTLDGKSLSLSDRSYSFNDTIDSDIEYTLVASDKYATCESKLIIKFVSPIYYGLIDEDLLDKRDSDIYTKNPLDMMNVLTKSIQPNASLHFKDYIIGNNKYFVAIIPKKYVYDEDGKFKITFFLPDIHDEAVINANRDDHTTPILTNGKLEKDSTMVSLDNYEMNIMVDGISYTNKYGYTEDYVIFKSNGYFTRLYDNFGFNIAIK